MAVAGGRKQFRGMCGHKDRTDAGLSRSRGGAYKALKPMSNFRVGSQSSESTLVLNSVFP